MDEQRIHDVVVQKRVHIENGNLTNDIKHIEPICERNKFSDIIDKKNVITDLFVGDYLHINCLNQELVISHKGLFYKTEKDECIMNINFCPGPIQCMLFSEELQSIFLRPTHDFIVELLSLFDVNPVPSAKWIFIFLEESSKLVSSQFTPLKNVFNNVNNYYNKQDALYLLERNNVYHTRFHADHPKRIKSNIIVNPNFAYDAYDSKNMGIRKSLEAKDNLEKEKLAKVNEELIVLTDDSVEKPFDSLKSKQIACKTEKEPHLSAVPYTSRVDETFSCSFKGLLLSNEDLACLEQGQLVNDNVINFYLRYIYFEKLNELQRKRVHLFISFFYNRLNSTLQKVYSSVLTPSQLELLKSNSNQASIVQNVPIDSVSPTTKKECFKSLNTWTRRVDIFEKDFVIIPINENSHWFLSLICYPWMVNMVSYTSMYQDPANSTNCLNNKYADLETSPETFDENVEDDFDVETRPDDKPGEAFDRWRRKRYSYLQSKGIKPMPCVLIFDSLPATKRHVNLKIVRDYLKLVWDNKRCERDGDNSFDKDTIRGFSPRVPGQCNLIDCGIFMLHYVECFFKNPVRAYTKSTFQTQFLEWFTQHQIDCKRDLIKSLIIFLKDNSKCDES